ncbi:DUF1080 domain-containing protein [Pseudoxanthomonas sp. z9]|uniref:3-keto-disaccharide hydrolase n=1 Tax=Pseudoxanthomonas sp. z9 TaxID=2584942 RepID=UPI001143DF74|nr:DUF1080 domain-containing protein [Pseudoxanthomonas sp. z9]
MAARRTLPALLALGLLASLSAVSATAAENPADALTGRWDITVHTPTGDVPSWLEIRRSGASALVGQFVGAAGSARPVSRVETDNGEMRFAIPPQWEGGNGDLSFQGRLKDGKLSGTMQLPDGKRHDWSAVRAPLLHRIGTPRWGQPIRLLGGKGLEGWRAIGQSSQWSVEDGVLRNAKAGANLVSEQRFTDFKLHVELRFPKGSNSGVYLRGRHEVQIADTFGEPASDSLGAIYGFLAPSEDASAKPGEWQSLDITLVGRKVTVAVNGKTVICDREIPGITGGALDSDEGAPGPLMLQGDHGPVEFRNITLTPAL